MRGAAARAAHPVAGRAAMTAESPAVTQPPATLLRVEGLACHFGGVLAVQDATFDVRRGTITGLIGPNGAGKSTVINLISGAFPDHFRQPPPLLLALRSALDDAHHVAQFGPALFVVRVELLPLSNDSLVQRMRYAAAH